MQFKKGTKVLTADGERVGSIDRVVLEPDTKEVTHLVIEKGFLFGEDKVVPMSLVGPATEEKVTLREDAGDLEKLPDFEESYYVPADTGPRRPPAPTSWARPMYLYPPVGTWWSGGGYATGVEPQYVVRTKRQIPEGTIALEEGAKVMGSDGEEIGEIEEIFTEPQENRATHLLVSEGLILKEKKLIPTQWVSTVLEKEVVLSVDSEFVEGLPEYQLED